MQKEIEALKQNHLDYDRSTTRKKKLDVNGFLE